MVVFATLKRYNAIIIKASRKKIRSRYFYLFWLRNILNYLYETRAFF
jgi:hypothetical protein